MCGGLIILVLGLVLVACDGTLDTATPAASFATATPTPTPTAIPNVLATSTPTAIPTVPRITATPQPTSTLPAVVSTLPASATSVPTFSLPTAQPNVIIAPTPTPESRIPATPTRPATATSAPTTVAPTIAPAIINPGAAKPDSEEQAFLQQLNDYRRANGRNPLTFDPLLYNSAHWLAQDMATHNYVGHTDSQGRNIPTRIKAFGYPGNWTGENIAGGLEKAADNLQIWQSDDIHKNNLLGPNYTKAAAARYYQKDSLNRWYWVLDLG
jgi:uncharacterized protein YkwD